MHLSPFVIIYIIPSKLRQCDSARGYYSHVTTYIKLKYQLWFRVKLSLRQMKSAVEANKIA